MTSTPRAALARNTLGEQLKQTSDKTTKLHEELRQAIETEMQLQIQLDDFQAEFKPDKEMNQHDSMDQFQVSTVFQTINERFHICY